MPLRSSIVDNLAGDLEYHPRRGVLYLVFSVAAFCYFYFIVSEAKFHTVRLVFLFGAIALLVKGIFLCRRSSEGLGLSETELNELSSNKRLQSLPNIAAQLLQDFGAGPLLFSPFLRIGQDNNALNFATEIQLFAAGVFLFAAGWGIRRATNNPDNRR